MAMQNLNQGNFQVNMTPPEVAGASEEWYTFGFGEDEAQAEKWLRGEVAANNQLARDMYFQDTVNRFNSSEAQKSRDWQENMSNTSYQRAVQDLKLAGLNPVLAYSNGGASTPQGATANSSSSRTNSTNNPANTATKKTTLGDIFNIVKGAFEIGAGLVKSPKTFGFGK